MRCTCLKKFFYRITDRKLFELHSYIMMFVTNERFSQVIIASHIIKHTTLANYIMQKLNKPISSNIHKHWIISSNKHWMASEHQNMNKILLPLHH